ncbi:MAG: hypothetical protein OHK0022_46130 [Roseiflexaceae bacterium]
MTSDPAEIETLRKEIAGLEAAIQQLAALPDMQRKLQQDLDERRHRLAQLQGGARPGAGPTVVNQYGGINFGINTSIGSIGKIVAGDEHVTEGPRFYGPVTAGRDINTATTMTVNNSPPPGESTPTVTVAQPGPALGLRLEDAAGTPLDTLTVGQEAMLRLTLEGDPAVLPALDLVLEAYGEGLSWPDDTRRPLLLRPGATPRLPRWTLLPERAGALTLRVLALAGGALIQQLTLTAAARAEGGATLSGPVAGPAQPQLAVPVGLALTKAVAVVAQADALTLVLSAEREGFRAMLLEGGSATVCSLALTRQGLADLLAYARSELLAVVYTSDSDGAHVPDPQSNPYVYQQRGLHIPEPVAEQSLARLARLGAALWDGLFAGPGSSADSVALGERLRQRSQAGALRLTITADHLPFPWALLYDRDPQREITADGFWGFRHVLAAVPTSGRFGPLTGSLALGRDGALRALVGLNEGLARHRLVQPEPVVARQRQTLAELGVATREVANETELRDAFATGLDEEVVYLYCHVVSELPDQQRAASPRVAAAPPGVGSTRIILTGSAQALMLRDLQQAAPLSRAPLLRGGPLVLLNACGSAELSPLTYDGLVPYLLDQGARTVIGTECETPIVFGSVFGAELLRAVALGSPVGAALRDTRRLFLAQHRNALGVIYGLYGSAELST